MAAAKHLEFLMNGDEVRQVTINNVVIAVSH